MDYTWFELVLFFMIYSFLGWAAEVLFTSLKTGHFCNRGFLTGPWCLAYGLAMDIILVVMDTLAQHYVLQYVFCVITASLFAYISGAVTEKITSWKLWDYELEFIFAGNKRGILFSLVLGGAAMLLALVVHPALFFLLSIVPDTILKVVSLVLLIIVLLDVMTIGIAAHYRAKISSTQAAGLAYDLEKGKKTLGNKLFCMVERRFQKAYPGIENGNVVSEKEYVFAKGICFDKFIWIFIIWAFLGDVIETVFVGLTAGKWMSRSSLIYGTFSIVWGLGAALATVFLHKLIGREDRYIFIGGFFLGGAYEYFCSVFTEIFFGTTFWDYSNMPFNIGGRTNLLFMLFWGIIAIIWLKFLYPTCSRLIEKVPVVAGKIITWAAIVIFVCDAVISVAAMTRYVARQDGVEPANKVELFVDYHYPDELVEFVWPNMRIQ